MDMVKIILYVVTIMFHYRILPPRDTPHFPTATSYLHTLLPHEIRSSNFFELEMLDKVTRVEVSPCKELNVSKSLTRANLESMLKLLQENQQEFVWDYTIMKGINPKLWTYRIYITPICKPARQPQRRVNLVL